MSIHWSSQHTQKEVQISRRPCLTWSLMLLPISSQTSSHSVAQPILELILWSKLAPSAWQPSWFQVLLTYSIPLPKVQSFFCGQSSKLLTHCGLMDLPWNSVRNLSFSPELLWNIYQPVVLYFWDYYQEHINPSSWSHRIQAFNRP